VPKHVGVLIIAIYCILLCAFVGGCTDCRNMHAVNDMKNSGKLLTLLISKPTNAHT
jgi:hypothetical protein